MAGEWWLTSIVADWQGGWARYRGRMADLATRHAPAVAGALLGLAAVTEAIARGSR